MSKDIPMYLRIKRQNQTFFIMCKEDDTVGYLKEQLAIAYSSAGSGLSTIRSDDDDDESNAFRADQMRLITKKDKTILENDDDKISDHESLKNDAEVYVVFQISDGEWEEVSVEETDPTTPQSTAP